MLWNKCERSRRSAQCSENTPRLTVKFLYHTSDLCLHNPHMFESWPYIWFKFPVTGMQYLHSSLATLWLGYCRFNYRRFSFVIINSSTVLQFYLTILISLNSCYMVFIFIFFFPHGKCHCVNINKVGRTMLWSHTLLQAHQIWSENVSFREHTWAWYPVSLVYWALPVAQSDVWSSTTVDRKNQMLNTFLSY